MNIPQKLKRFDSIQTAISLADRNWFKTGGLAEYFAEPESSKELKEVVQFALEKNLSIALLGKGANMLVSDEGVRGLVICPRIDDMGHIEIVEGVSEVTAGAGTDLNDLIVYCLENNLIGLEEFSGIPGTVGGAVYINLHYFDFLLSHFLVRATVLEKETGNFLSVENEWFAFGYNRSKLHEGKHILVDATFRVCASSWHEVYYAHGRRDEIIRHRQARYPNKNTCGSFFRNFYENEVSLEINGKKAIWAAYYLDKSGLKGELRVGGAQVSHQHANMIVNLGNATTADIIAVARLMQKKVRDEFGIVLQPECRLIGFDSYPLFI